MEQDIKNYEYIFNFIEKEVSLIHHIMLYFIINIIKLCNNFIYI